MKLIPNKLGAISYLMAVYLFLYLPIMVLIHYSFNSGGQTVTWQGFTWSWYTALCANRELQVVAMHSVLIALLAASLATMLGTVAAGALYKYQFFGKKLIYGVVFVLIISPDIVTGISLLVLFTALKIPLGFLTLLLSHITFCLPFVIVTVYARLNDIDRNIFEAAKDLGASDGIVFHKIMIPLLLPAIIAGWLLSFTLSMDDVVISFFVTGSEFNVLPLKIFSMVRAGVKPEINALCSIMFGISLSLVLLYQAVNKGVVSKKHANQLAL
jgi:spermidine/putrescine transport system permease protein